MNVFLGAILGAISVIGSVIIFFAGMLAEFEYYKETIPNGFTTVRYDVYSCHKIDLKESSHERTSEH